MGGTERTGACAAGAGRYWGGSAREPRKGRRGSGVERRGPPASSPLKRAGSPLARPVSTSMPKKPKPSKRLWLREVKAILALAIALFVLLSLMSFDPFLPDEPNHMGIVGSWVAWGLFWSVGYAAYLLSLGGIAYGLLVFVRPAVPLSRTSPWGFALGFVAVAGLLGRLSESRSEVRLHQGGTLGWAVNAGLQHVVGPTGGLLVLATAVLCGFLLVTHLSYILLSVRAVRGLRVLFKRTRRTKAVPEPEQLTLPVAVAPAIQEESPAPPVVEIKPPKPDLVERGLAWQERFEFAEKGQLFQLPPMASLKTPPPGERRRTREELQANADLLRKKLQDFGVEGRIVQVNPGPVITGYEFEPAPGIKVNQVVNLADDLALAMKAAAVRVVGPVPGRGTVAIEVPNPEPSSVYLREILISREYVESKSKLTLALGKDVIGQPTVADLAAMPHLLIAGATGSGKSVCLNAMICSILYKATPAEVRFLLIDPKRLELGVYDGIPHLMAPVVTDPKEAAARLRWLTGRMDERYRLLASKAVRNIEGYNQSVPPEERIPYWVVIVDELADLMMVSSGDVENSLARLAQVARAVGIHLLVATQRPSVDVITGLIKANFPARLSFQVSSRVDSRTILDQNGAEQLLGKGDMLFVPPGASRTIRVHGAWVSEEEIRAIVQFLKRQGTAVYEEVPPMEAGGAGAFEEAERDDLYWKAVELVVNQRQASISFIQRRLGLGYPKAARYIDLMQQDGIVGPGDGAKPRHILVGLEYLSRRGR